MMPIAWHVIGAQQMMPSLPVVILTQKDHRGRLHGCAACHTGLLSEELCPWFNALLSPS